MQKKEQEKVVLDCDYFPLLKGKEYRVIDRGYDHLVLKCRGANIRVPFWAIQGMSGDV